MLIEYHYPSDQTSFYPANMATASTENDTSQDLQQNVSPAQRLQEKHAASAPRRPIVEDVVDEEDLIHPPPSSLVSRPAASTPIENKSLAMSEKAAGKQKAKDEPEEPLRPTVTTPPTVPLDTKSEDAFPALGGGPKPKNAAPVSMAWGARKPLGEASAVPNGINGQGPMSSSASSRASTPASGKLPTTSTNPSVGSQPRGPTPQHMPIPGRHSERIQFAPSQLLPRNQLKKPLQDVLRSINKGSKAKVEMKPGPNGTLIFEGTGPVDAARQALRDVAKEVGSKVSSGPMTSPQS